MRRSGLLVAVVGVMVIAAAVVCYRQHIELQVLRVSHERLGELCRHERNHAQTIAQDLRDSNQRARALAAESFVRFYEWTATLEACMPGSNLEIGGPRQCWQAKEDPECLLPIATEIAVEFERHWSPK